MKIKQLKHRQKHAARRTICLDLLNLHLTRQREYKELLNEHLERADKSNSNYFADTLVEVHKLVPAFEAKHDLAIKQLTQAKCLQCNCISAYKTCRKYRDEERSVLAVF